MGDRIPRACPRPSFSYLGESYAAVINLGVNFGVIQSSHSNFQSPKPYCDRIATVEAYTKLTCLTLKRATFTELLGPMEKLMTREKSPQVNIGRSVHDGWMDEACFSAFIMPALTLVFPCPLE